MRDVAIERYEERPGFDYLLLPQCGMRVNVSSAQLAVLVDLKKCFFQPKSVGILQNYSGLESFIKWWTTLITLAL